MRLGDLDALKEDFKSRLADCNKWIEKAKDKETKIRASAVKAFICEVIMTIDNAPTVEERPQGEWVGNAFDEHHCKRCGHPALWEEEPDGYYEVQSRFCPNCGLQMKGGTE